jgi:transketolase
VLEGTDVNGVARGGYVLSDTSAEVGNGLPDVLLIATGSEVQYAVAAQQTLAAEGIGTRVVSMPCVEWFDEQEQAYRDQVLPPTVKARVAVEAGVAMPWYRFVGDHGEVVSLEHFGASADWQTLFREFGFTGEAVADAARRSLGHIKQ